jgi:gliding motility-associated-like protein
VKKTQNKLYLTSLIIGMLSWASFFCTNAKAQETNTAKKMIQLDGEAVNENQLRERMKNDGVSRPMIDRFIAERKLLNIKNAQLPQLKKNNTLPVPFAACSDMGVENGWGTWVATPGTANSGSQSWGAPLAAPVGPRFNLTTGAGNDACTPGVAPGSPPIPVVAPGFGNTSIQIGQPQVAGYGAEMLQYQLTVGPADTNFIFSYAIVLQDAGHSAADQPFVELCIKDSNGNPVPCGCFRYTGGPNLPGFFTGTCGAYYKPWTIVGVNLSAYVGQTLTVTILNVDCAQGGHYAHSYWDFTCKPLSSSASAFCVGQPASICAPSDPSISYTYQWHQNGNPYTGPPSATSQCITPLANVGDTFTVDVIQPSNCNFHMTYAPQPMVITPNFTSAIQCNTVNFTDVSTTSNGSPIVAWNWNFPSGTPTTATTQTATVTYPAGSFTATLVVTSQSGCTDTVIKPVNVNGLPQAAFSVNTVCSGNATLFSDNSVAGVGDPIVSWNWNFPGGTPATATTQSPSVTYPPGNYTASLTVTSQGGCTSSITQSVTVNPLPLANMSGNNTCFNNLTIFTDLSTGNNTVSNWNWNFGDGNTSTVQGTTHTYSAPGTYTVTLIVTNNFGCKDTNTITVVVNPLPAANFSSLPVCFHDSTCFGDLSTISSGSVTGWSWNFGDVNSGSNNISHLKNPCHIFTGLGPFTVLLTATSNSGCQSNTTLQATINPLPVAAITPQNVCINFPALFSDASTAQPGDPLTTWDWNFGDGSPHFGLTNPSHNYAAPGTYTVTLIITSTKGCKDTTTNTVTIYNNPVAAFSSPDSGCSPVCQTFHDLSTSQNGNITNWAWNFPGGSPSVGQNSTSASCWDNPGSYNVQLMVTTQYGCKNTLLMTNYINVFAWPHADFCIAPDQASVNAPVFNFCDLWTPDVSQWMWNFGDTTTDNTSTKPVHSYSATATNNDYYSYNVCLYVQNQHGCWDSICKPVELFPEFEFFIPNCFTPNGDNANEFFFGKGRGIKDYNIWIFDRWGNMIWNCHREDKNTNWDSEVATPKQEGLSSFCKWDGIVEGSTSGESVQEDVYVWKVKLTDIFDKVHNYIGHVSVVK